MRQLAGRVRNLLIRPDAEWRVIKDEPSTYSAVLFRYVALLSAVPPLAALAGRIVFDGNISRERSLSLGYLMLTNAIWYCTYVLTVMIVGALISLIIMTRETRTNGLHGIKIAAYAYTPLYLAGLIAVVPSMRWILYPAIVYGLYLIFLGINHVVGFPRAKAAGYALFSFVVAGSIVAMMNLFEYFLESLIVTRVL